jgi:methyl-accepting chemotaxis protein
MSGKQAAKLEEMATRLKKLRDAGNDTDESYRSLRREFDKLSDTLDPVNNSIKRTRDSTDGLRESTDKATTVLGKMSAVARHTGDALGGLANTAYAGAHGYDKFIKSVNSGMSAIESGGSLLGDLIPTKLIGKIPLLGTAFNETFGIIGKIGTAAIKVSRDIITLASTVTKAVDQTTAGHREQVKSIFEIGKQYGSTVGDAEKFTSSMRKAASSDFSKRMYLGVKDFDGVMQGIRNTSLTIDDMSESVNVGSDSMKAFNAVAAHQKALGILSAFRRSCKKAGHDNAGVYGDFCRFW